MRSAERVTRGIPSTEQSPPRRLLRDDVYTALHDSTIDGATEPGAVLRDEELIAWHGASHTPIRRALDTLDHIELVETPPCRFTKVASSTPPW
ncbi:GntR family transcriptional regulator [Microbacterium sp. NPDC089695]|uniref:GntR family transcriptional regulator n=1 Tax=Microbacterium sp. NPDC089695 TaxID=3364198 RepID=UPI00381C22C5